MGRKRKTLERFFSALNVFSSVRTLSTLDTDTEQLVSYCLDGGTGAQCGLKVPIRPHLKNPSKMVFDEEREGERVEERSSTFTVLIYL